MESSRNGGQTSIGGKCRLGVNVHPSPSLRGGIADEAIQGRNRLDCIAALAMTG